MRTFFYNSSTCLRQSYAAVSIHESFTHHNPTKDFDHILTLQSRRFGKIWHLKECKGTTAVHCPQQQPVLPKPELMASGDKNLHQSPGSTSEGIKSTPIFICSHFLYHKQNQWGFCGNVKWTHTTPLVFVYKSNSDLLFCIPDHQGSAWLYGKATSRQ